MHSYIVLRLQTTNDNSGNPRRLLTVIDKNKIMAYDEGYDGHMALPEQYREGGKTPLNINISYTEYKRLKTLYYVG